jgi:hypothetical protein
MKRLSRIILLSLAGFILLVMVLLFTVPVLFKDNIRTKVEQVINESVNASVSFGSYKLGFFRNFPNLSFSLDKLAIVGQDEFENDTLAAFESFDIVFNLGSLLKKSGYEVKSIILNEASMNAVYLEDGKANWDIFKESAEQEEEDTDSAESDLKILLKKVTLLNSSLSYIDKSSNMSAFMNDINFYLKGDMSMSETDMEIILNAGDVSFIMDGIKYLDKAVAESRIDLLADLENMQFSLGENYLALNDLKLGFTGVIEMPEDDIRTDISFETQKTSFKTLLSLIPAVFMKDFEELQTSGEFALTGSAIGIYSDVDSTLPDINLKLRVDNGSISYPSLPEDITNINISLDLFADGRDPDNTTLDIDDFHLELADNPFDFHLSLRTPISDPDFNGSMIGKIDLSALTNAIPFDSLELSGTIDMSVMMKGRLSMIEKEEYENFQASGNMGIMNMLIAMTGYPEVNIKEAGFEFSPAFAALTKADLMVGEKSDMNLSGRLENYVPYLFKDGIIKGNMTLISEQIDVTDLLESIATDTTQVEDTTSLAVIRIPENIDFDFNASINNLNYGSINVREMKGHIIIRNGVLNLKETEMDILGGIIAMDADYDTRDSLKPLIRAGLSIQNLGVKDAYNTFNTIQKLAPAAAGVDGKVNVEMNYESLLGGNMMPLVHTITGGGNIRSDEVTLVTSAAYDKMKELLKLGENFTNVFKDINVSFNLKDGRVYVKPFDTKVGDIRMNISGDQGIDQTMNYVIRTEIPRSALGGSVNSLIDNLSSQASAFGLSIKPADIMKINVKVGGVFGKPVVTPLLGSSSGDSESIVTQSGETIKEAVGATIDSGKDRLREEAEERGDELIREAEMRAQQLREEAATGAEKIRKEADLQAENLVREASDKGTLARIAADRAAEALRNEADKKAAQLIEQADIKADRLIDEARIRKQEMIEKI